MQVRREQLRLVVAVVFGCAGIVSARASEDDQPTGRSFAAAALRGSIFVATEAPRPAPNPAAPAAAEPPAAPIVTAASEPTPPPAARDPSATKFLARPAPEPSWPRTLTEVRRAKEAPKQTGWSKAEIDQARQSCSTLLDKIDVVALPVEPFRDGDCGAPAAVQLVSIGRNPEVTFSPPPVVSCEMVVGLNKWLATLQSSATKHLGAPLIRMEVMSSYSCRNAYGLRSARLSEHGRANALDISGFLTAGGYETAVLDHWGPTQREIARADKERALAAAKPAVPAVATAEAPKPAAPAAPVTLAMPAAPRPVAAPPPAFVAGRPVALPPPAIAIRPVTPAPPPAVARAPAPDAIGNGLRTLAGQVLPNGSTATFNPPSHLGGPRTPTRALVVSRDVPADRKARFLKDIHDSACRIFGTVLGPEANRAHENHFHVDMAERRTGSFCE